MIRRAEGCSPGTSGTVTTSWSRRACTSITWRRQTVRPRSAGSPSSTSRHEELDHDETSQPVRGRDGGRTAVGDTRVRAGRSAPQALSADARARDRAVAETVTQVTAGSAGSAGDFFPLGAAALGTGLGGAYAAPPYAVLSCVPVC